jgi:hypothetical protein
MGMTEKTLNLQHYQHHHQHFCPLESCDAPCILLVSERYTGNIAKNIYLMLQTQEVIKGREGERERTHFCDGSFITITNRAGSNISFTRNPKQQMVPLFINE